MNGTIINGTANLDNNIDFIVYSKKVYIELVKLGFYPKATVPNPVKTELISWVFDNTPELRKSVEQIKTSLRKTKEQNFKNENKLIILNTNTKHNELIPNSSICQEISGSGLKLYFYLINQLNSNNNFILDDKKAMISIRLSMRQYLHAFEELKKKSFLIQQDDKEIYNFIINPSEVKD